MHKKQPIFYNPILCIDSLESKLADFELYEYNGKQIHIEWQYGELIIIS